MQEKLKRRTHTRVHNNSYLLILTPRNVFIYMCVCMCDVR